MVPSILKESLVPGSLIFFLLVATLGTLLTYRKNGRAGRIILTILVLLYWGLSTPAIAVPLIRLLTPDYPPVRTAADAHGATAIVVLGGGMETYRSRGAALQAGSREHTVRVLEAARVYRVLDKPWVIVTGSLGFDRPTEATWMARTLEDLGVARDRLVEEGKSRNTRDHTVYVPPLLRERHVTQFVLVTSRQHIERSLRVFRKAGWNPVPSSPDFYVPRGLPLEPVIPSRAVLEASSALIYDLLGGAYYKARGWI